MLFTIIFLLSCTQETNNKYSIYYRGKDKNNEFLSFSKDLQTSFIKSMKSSISLGPTMYYNLLSHKGQYYHFDYPASRVTHLRFEKNRLIPQDSCFFKILKGEVETHYFVGDSLLVFIGWDKSYTNHVFAEIALDADTIRRELVLPLPELNKNEIQTIGFSVIKNNCFYLSFTTKYKNHENGSVYKSADSLGFLVLDYPSMSHSRTYYDPRTTFSLYGNMHQPTSFTNEKGDSYFITNTSERFGNSSRPSGILRIRKEEEILDSTYFFNISGSPIREYPYAIWYLGGNQALVKTGDNNLVTDWTDYNEKNIYHYYHIDLEKQTFHKLDIPLDVAWYVNNVQVVNGKAYIANIPTDRDNHIWVYDPSSKILQQEVEFSSAVERVFDIYTIR